MSDTRFLLESLGPAEGDFSADTRLLPGSEPEDGVLGPRPSLDDGDLLSTAGSVLARWRAWRSGPMVVDSPVSCRVGADGDRPGAGGLLSSRGR